MVRHEGKGEVEYRLRKEIYFGRHMTFYDPGSATMKEEVTFDQNEGKDN